MSVSLPPQAGTMMMAFPVSLERSGMAVRRSCPSCPGLFTPLPWTEHVVASVSVPTTVQKDEERYDIFVHWDLTITRAFCWTCEL